MASNRNRHVAQIIGSNIARARAEKGLTQHALALAIDARADQVSKWEAGRHRPDLYLPALCNVLGKELPWFYTDHDAEPTGAAA